MNHYYCNSCRKDRRHNLFVDVTSQLGGVIQVLASCSECNKGRWVEVSEKRYSELKEEHEKKK